MLNEKLLKLLNEQVNKELYSAYLYLDMANFYVNKNLDGFAHWFKEQAKEEYEHAMKFVEYIQGNLQEVEYEAIAKPNLKFKDLNDPLVNAFNHEQYVTASINAIYDLAFGLKDYRTMEFLNWFVKEQMEEEENADKLVQSYAAAKGDAAALFLLDKKLGKREE